MSDAAQRRRIEHAVVAAEYLARIAKLDPIVGQSEAFARELLPCDEARVVLADTRTAPEPDRSWVDTLCVSLPAPQGGRLGWMIAGRRRGVAFSADDEAVFEVLARSVTLAVQVGVREAEATAAQARIETLLSRINEGVAEFDAAFNLRSINDAGARALKLPRGWDVTGINLWDLSPGDAAGEFGTFCQAAMEGHGPLGASARFRGLDAIFALRAYPHATGLTLLFLDVTAQHRVEQRKSHSARLESVGHLTGGVAHDVNNLLTVMLGNFDAIAERNRARSRGQTVTLAEPVDAPDTDAALAMAGARAGETATRLIRRLLAFSRDQPVAVQPIDVERVVRSLAPMIRRSVGGNIRVRINCAPKLWAAVADPAELESAMLNMALNAQDAMPDGGVLDITAENVEVDRLYAKVGGFERTGSFVMVTVLDNGFGMTPETREQAFDPFFTTKELGVGTGLGLSMVHGFARQSGGHVLLDSEPGQGTILRLYLPRSREKPAASVVADAPREAVGVGPGAGGGGGEPEGARGEREHILLVEDHPMLRAHAERMLASLGYRVTSAADGPEAMRHLAAGLSPDMLFADVMLPGGMSGPELARAAKALRPGLAVLFTSGHAHGALLRDQTLLPGMALLAKPFRRREIATAVRMQLDAMGPEQARH